MEYIFILSLFDKLKEVLNGQKQVNRQKLFHHFLSKSWEYEILVKHLTVFILIFRVNIIGWWAGGCGVLWGEQWILSFYFQTCPAYLHLHLSLAHSCRNYSSGQSNKHQPTTNISWLIDTFEEIIIFLSHELKSQNVFPKVSHG